MKKISIVFVLAAAVFMSTRVMAQIYNDKYEAMTEPMARVALQHKAMASTAPEPGAVEDETPQDIRYLKMTQRMDTAADRSLNAEYRTIEEATVQSGKAK